MDTKSMWVLGVLVFVMAVAMGYGLKQERKQIFNVSNCGQCHGQNSNASSSWLGITYDGDIGVKIGPGLVLRSNGNVDSGH